MPTIKIHNAETDEVIEREMNAEELLAYEKNMASIAAEKQAIAEAEAKRSAALTKLEALGLDEDDLKALGL